MNNLFNWLLPIGLMLSIAQPSFAQQAGITISGVVICQQDGQPVRQASVSVHQKGLGTATNAGGRFALNIPAANLADTLKISCIGFQTQSFPISRLANNEVIHAALVKNAIALQDVSVTYYDAAKIIQKAIARIAENYINHPHVLRGFYRLYSYSDRAPLQLSEAVFDVYNFGYADTRADLFHLIRARSEKNERDFSSVEFVQQPNTIFEQDVVNHLTACGFLNEEGLSQHQFEVTGIVDIKSYRAFEIEFKEKPGSGEKTFRGRMFIDTKTYAFVGFDFGLSPVALNGFGAAIFIQRSLVTRGDTVTGLLADNLKVSYQQVGNKWVLSGVEGEDSFLVKRPGLAQQYVAHTKFNYQVTAVDTVRKESFSSKLGRGDNINAYKAGGSEAFWKDYNILLSDYNTEDIFRQLKAINKSAAR